MDSLDFLANGLPWVFKIVILCSMVTPRQCREFVEARASARRRANLSLAERAAEDFRKIIAVVVGNYSPTRVWQWGSLLRPERFSELSDIDIAVEGIIEPGQFFSMLEDASQLTSFPIDLVQMERIEPEYADLIRSKGVVVYERGS